MPGYDQLHNNIETNDFQNQQAAQQHVMLLTFGCTGTNIVDGPCRIHHAGPLQCGRQCFGTIIIGYCTKHIRLWPPTVATHLHVFPDANARAQKSQEVMKDADNWKEKETKVDQTISWRANGFSFGNK